MRMWHYKLLPFIPDKQFRGQLRELIAIKRNWERKRYPHHMLVDRVTDYSKSHFNTYFKMYCDEYSKRYGKKVKQEYADEIDEFCGHMKLHGCELYAGWHGNEYLRICMSNIFEKYTCSGFSVEEWSILKSAYKAMTGEVYHV